jgi:hypothetical protein
MWIAGAASLVHERGAESASGVVIFESERLEEPRLEGAGAPQLRGVIPSTIVSVVSVGLVSCTCPHAKRTRRQRITIGESRRGTR